MRGKRRGHCSDSTDAPRSAIQAEVPPPLIRVEVQVQVPLSMQALHYPKHVMGSIMRGVAKHASPSSSCPCSSSAESDGSIMMQHHLLLMMPPLAPPPLPVPLARPQTPRTPHADSAADSSPPLSSSFAQRYVKPIPALP